MSLSCDYEVDGDVAWYYEPAPDFAPLTTKRSRKCCSCGCKIAVCDDSLKFRRWRDPKSDVAERIHGDEEPLASWYMCEKCAGLFMSLSDLDFCCDIGSDIAEQIKEYRAEEEEFKRSIRK